MRLDRGRILRDARAVHRAWFELQAVAAGGEVVRLYGVPLTYLPAGEGSATLAFPSLRGLETGAALDEIVAWCRERRPLRTVGCWLGGRASRRLGAGLLARGFEWGWQAHWMGLDVADLPSLPSPATPAHVQVETDPDPDVWESHEHPYHGPTGSGDQRIATRLLAAAGERAGDHLRHVVAWLDGRPVGSTVIFRVGPVAGVFDVGVLPDVRNRGIGTAVTGAALHIARTEGCTRAVLNATPLGEPVYRRLGFESGGRGQTFWMHREALESPPPDPAIVSFIEAVGTEEISTLDAGRSAIPPEQLDAPLLGGLRPIDVAVKLRSPRSVRWLVSHGATLDVRAACELGWRDRIPGMLTERPELADLRTGQEGATALHWAALNGDAELAEWLLAAGADPTLKDRSFDSTPAGWARHFGHAQLADRIESKGRSHGGD